jgi:hypothetical protein
LRGFLLENREFPEHYHGLQAAEIRQLTCNDQQFVLEDLRLQFECCEIYNEDIMDLSADWQPRDKTGNCPARAKLALKENNRKIFIKGFCGCSLI